MLKSLQTTIVVNKPQCEEMLQKQRVTNTSLCLESFKTHPKPQKNRHRGELLMVQNVNKWGYVSKLISFVVISAIVTIE